MLTGHHARDLRHVSKVVHDPRGEQLSQRDRAELRMFSGAAEFSVREPPACHGRQALRAEAREIVEQIAERPILSLVELCEGAGK